MTTTTSTCEPDIDGDTVPDQSDLDNDNDGIPDLDETGGNIPYGDEDGDGILNGVDTNDNGNAGDSSPTNYSDSNSDGIPDIYDTDLDGIPNHLDLDSDNDGIFDAVEAGHGQAHTNGIVNSVFGANGLANVVETSSESGIINYSILNIDGTGSNNYLDLDSDGDGLPDNVEAQTTLGYSPPSGNDTDSNGVDDAYDSNGTVIIPTNTDGTDNPDYLDTDSDNDGISDTAEASITLSGSDSDNDGLDNSIDTTTGYLKPAGKVGNPLNTNNGTIALPDWDNDATIGGDVDYRDDTDDSLNEPPNIEATGDQVFCVGSVINVAETISITDEDDTELDAAFIQITSGFDSSGDLLALTGSHPNIIASWDQSEGKLSLTGPATLSEFDDAILDVTFQSTAAMSSNDTREFSIVLAEANYLQSTQHYYEYIPALGITWTDARDAAELRTFYGLKGYLATLTNPDEAYLLGKQSSGAGWIGASDADVEGEWFWVTGPEAGNQFWSGDENGFTTAPYNFANWNNGEPNDSAGEDYAHINAPGTGFDGSWNDLSNIGSESGSFQPKGYLVEYGGTPGDPEAPNISRVTKITVDYTAPTANNPSSVTVFCKSDVPEPDVSLVTDEADTCDSNPTVSFIADESNGGNPEIITRTYRVTDNAGNYTEVYQSITVEEIVINDHPVDQYIISGNNAVFTITSSNADTFQWQVNIDGGGYTNLVNDTEHSGTQTSTLTVMNVPKGKEGYSYRVFATNANATCAATPSNSALLFVEVKTVITNKRITYRIKPN